MTVAATTVLALTGCGGGSARTAAAGTTSTRSPTSTTSTSAEANAPAATVEQYASIIAKERADISEAADTLKPCAIDQSGFVCVITLMSVGLEAQTLDIELGGASIDGPGNQLYIGPPPVELAKLVADTRAAAQDVQTKADAYDACKRSCGDEFAQAYFAANDLNDQVAAWEPYL